MKIVPVARNLIKSFRVFAKVPMIVIIRLS